MYDMFDKEQSVVSDEEMKEVMKHGKRLKVCDGELEVTSYLYKDRVYIYDIQKSNRGD
jgi:hypothetical protein